MHALQTADTIKTPFFTIIGIHAGFPGAASVYYYCDDMPSVVMYEYQWDAISYSVRASVRWQ